MMWCAISRYRISRRCDQGRPLGWLVRRHVEHCPSCRRYERNLLDLGRRLADDARRDVPTVSPGLHERILRAVGDAAGNSAPVRVVAGPRPGRLRLYALSGLAAAAAILLAFTLFQAFRHDADQAKPPIVKITDPGTGGAEILPGLLDIPNWVLAEMTEPFHNEVRELKRTGKQVAGVVLDHASWLLGEDLPTLNGDAG